MSAAVVDATDLARLAVASPWWCWLPGMLTAGGIRVDTVDEDGRPYRIEGSGDVACYGLRGTDLPDFDDAATVGCLLAMVRRAWGRPGIVAVCHARGTPPDPGMWGVHDRGYNLPTSAATEGATEAAALVAWFGT